MIRFLFGVFCGVVSGAVTWWLSADPGVTTVAVLAAAVLAWVFGGLALVLFDE
ncbi:hypothetical protein ACFWU5_16395 [Nocardia sp. NPDC058640]|uniref:hypothetical protein n=1 Tax=Nocardia sp. NPDC058640 TaxID=3346571 RepID=UPI003653C5C0